MLYFFDASQPSLEFVRDRLKTNNYFRLLKEAGQTHQTRNNYVKAMKRFIDYHTVNTNLYKTDPELHQQAKLYVEFLQKKMKEFAKGIGIERVSIRSGYIRDGLRTPEDCWRVLEVAKPDFLVTVGKVIAAKGYTDDLSQSECTTVQRYLIALIILKHLQRPGVVTGMTVGEWHKRVKKGSGGTVVLVKKHKTAAQQPAAFVLDQEQEAWFEAYYECVREHMKQGCRGDGQKAPKRRKMEQRATDGEKVVENAEEPFFLNLAGSRIKNPSLHLSRLHTKYKLPDVNSDEVRKVFETATVSECFEAGDKKLFSNYLSHTVATAEGHYQMKQISDLIKATELIKRLGSSERPSDRPSTSSEVPSPSEEQSEDSSGSTATLKPSANKKMTDQILFDRFQTEFPVTVDDLAPTREKRLNFLSTLSVEEDRESMLYNRWVKKQRKLRQDYTLEHMSQRHCPSKKRIERFFLQQGWKHALPNIDQITQSWKPAEDPLSSPRIRRLVSSQRWKGLEIKSIPDKGRGVFTRRAFKMGEVVCDYHGDLLTAAQGQAVHESTIGEETGYMYFFLNEDGEKMCIDAHQKCQCHPDMDVKGRLINHSRKPNLKPLSKRLDLDGDKRDYILFVAKQDISEGEELTFDYGVNKFQFGGEARDLDWL
ncbi:uncharacterized protein LOC130131646 isoform X5 [Lampris incognitus]|nr:uncharacterized protein LOC130131646 isoform X5 [Lampris incognitus]